MSKEIATKTPKRDRDFFFFFVLDVADSQTEMGVSGEIPATS